MFCACKNDPELKEPNSHICPICLAHPGTLPVPNKTAIEWTVKIGRALNCSIREFSNLIANIIFILIYQKAIKYLNMMNLLLKWFY